MTTLAPDRTEAERFLTLLDETADQFTFQTFDDLKVNGKNRKDGGLAKVLNGTLDQHFDQLARLNGMGAGVFVTVNETDLHGRELKNIVRPRATFQDADDPAATVPDLEPHIEVQSSPGKFQRYWLLGDDCPSWEEWRAVENRLVVDHKADANAKDPARVLRLPGFFHLKDPTKPHQVRIVEATESLPYSWAAVTQALPPLHGKPPKADGTTEAPGRPQDAFAEAVGRLGRKLREGEGRRDMMLRYAGSLAARGLSAMEINGLLQLQAETHFENGWADCDDANLREIIHYCLRKNAPPPPIDLSGLLGKTTIDPATGDIHSDSANKLPKVDELVWNNGKPGFVDIWGEWTEVKPPEDAKSQTHPLANFVELQQEPLAPRIVVPGFIGHGVTIIAGGRGVGKTTTLLPLAMQVADIGITAPELTPMHWRHVVYVVEDIEQAQRIVSGLVRYGGLGIDWATVKERLHLVEARRLKPGYVAEVGAMYRDKFTRLVDCPAGQVEVDPLVVLDTIAATLELENENDNSESSRAMAALKTGFSRLPVWMVGHIAKSNLGRSDLAGLTARGAGAFESDANGVLYLVQEGDMRYLVRGKTRFEARWPELEVTSHCTEVMAQNEFGGTEPVRMRWTTIAPPQQTRQEAAKDTQEQARKEAVGEIRQAVRDAIQVAWQAGLPLNREGVKSGVKHKRNDVTDCIENLLSEGWIYEVSVPSKLRTNSRKSAFLINLDTVEHEDYQRDGVLPADKLVIPKSWQKQPNPSVPDENATEAENDSKK